MDNVRVKLSTGRVVEFHPLSAREQLNADRSSRGDATKLPYYRTAAAISSIDGEPTRPSASSIGLEGLIDKFKGFEVDEIRRVYGIQFSPFLKAYLETLAADDKAPTDEDELDIPAIVSGLVSRDDESGNFLFTLSSGKTVELRAITAREQMNADSWGQGDPVLGSYFRAIMALTRFGDEAIERPESSKDALAILGKFSGLDVDEIGVVYSLKFNAQAEVLKNEPSPLSSDSSPAQ